MKLDWNLHDPRMTLDHLGYIPEFLSDTDPRPAREQIDDNYVFGGWRPMDGWKLTSYPGPDSIGDIPAIKYPGDPAEHALATTRLRTETIAYFNHSWVAIIQPNGEFEVARLD